MANDGVPLSALYGADINPSFEAEGHGLFRDSDRLDSSRFITGDIFSNSDSDDLTQTIGTWDVIHIAMFLHAFSRAAQEEACRKILLLLKGIPGSMVFGTQTGNLDSGEVVLKPPLCEPGEERTLFRQNKETLMSMWERAALETGLRVNVWTAYDEDHVRQRNAAAMTGDNENQKQFFHGSRERRIFFRVEII